MCLHGSCTPVGTCPSVRETFVTRGLCRKTTSVLSVDELKSHLFLTVKVLLVCTGPVRPAVLRESPGLERGFRVHVFPSEYAYQYLWHNAQGTSVVMDECTGRSQGP